MKIDSLKNGAVLIFTLCLSYQTAYAQEKEKEMVEPPQEMHDACKDRQIGEACSYTDNFSKKVSGRCTKDTRVVLCYPEEVKKDEKH